MNETEESPCPECGGIEEHITIEGVKCPLDPSRAENLALDLFSAAITVDSSNWLDSDKAMYYLAQANFLMLDAILHRLDRLDD